LMSSTLIASLLDCRTCGPVAPITTHKRKVAMNTHDVQMIPRFPNLEFSVHIMFMVSGVMSQGAWAWPAGTQTHTSTSTLTYSHIILWGRVLHRYFFRSQSARGVAGWWSGVEWRCCSQQKHKWFVKTAQHTSSSANDISFVFLYVGRASRMDALARLATSGQFGRF
jgi:hypothetical protein